MNGVPGYSGAIVNPTLITAIESTRQFLAFNKAIPTSWSAQAQVRRPDWRAGRPGSGPAGLDPKADAERIDHPDRLRHWQGDVRATVLTFEVMAGLGFTSEQGRATLTARVDDGKAPGVEALVTMSRPADDVLEEQAREVVKLSQMRLMPKSQDVASRDRLAEITAQVAPPFAFWCAALPIQPERMPRTIELMQLALTLASFGVQRFKHALAVARPHHVNPAVFPAILTPGHASLPSGHATEAFTVANVLASLLDAPDIAPGGAGQPTIRTLLLAVAARIADNRHVAGLHYPIDTLAGRLLGTVLARYLLSRSTGAAHWCGEFHGERLRVVNGTVEEHAIVDSMAAGAAQLGALPWRVQADVKGLDLCPGGADQSCTLLPADVAGPSVPTSEALAWLFEEARAEWGLGPWTGTPDGSPETAAAA